LFKINFLKNSIAWLLHVSNQRYLAIYFDPVLACNLRCQSCYFSNAEERKKLQGVFKQEEIHLIAKSFFPRALRLQIGCGAEPTLYQYNPDLIRLGKKYHVPYISLTTNANLLTPEMILDLLEAGLDELTISIHGVNKETYETLMTNASFEKLMKVMQIITDLKPNFPKFKLRLNFTINNQNVEELKFFFDVYGKYKIDILQLRSLRNIGGVIRSVDVNDEFNIILEEALMLLNGECQKRNITFIKPDKFLSEHEETKESKGASYCYISPQTVWHPDFDWRNETFSGYSRRTKYASKLFRSIFS
jgi:MoaA/NifB/PqqE/SkfB family radical SAM enzyme